MLYPEIVRPWHHRSSYLVLLTVADELELERLHGRLAAEGLVTLAWREPDWDDALTALAVEPGPRAGRLLSTLPLTLRATKSDSSPISSLSSQDALVRPS